MKNLVYGKNRSLTFMIILPILVVCIIGNALEMEFSFSSADIVRSTYQEYDVLTLKDAITIGPVGSPSLPVLPLLMIAPSNAVQAHVTVVTSEWNTLPDDFFIYPIQPPSPIGSESMLIAPDQAIYTDERPYPYCNCTPVGIGNMGGFRILQILICPFSYAPATGVLRFCSRLRISIDYEYSNTTSHRTEWQNRCFKNIIKNIVINPQDVDRFAPATRAIGQSSPTLQAGDYHEVYIIEESLEEHVQEIIYWRTKQGVPCTTMTVSNIVAQYPGWDIPEKIRNFIKDANSSWGALYFTLAGDTGHVPTRILINQLESTVATDLYYSDLDSTWDADGDHIYAEEEDSAACDWYSDVFVGRIPTTTIGHVDNFVNKLFTYEKNPPAGYLCKCLLPAAYLWHPYGGDIVNDSIANYTPAGWQDSKLYEMYGNASHQETLDSLNAGFGFVHFSGHGNLNGIYWDGAVDTFLFNTDIPTLTNGEKLGVYNSIACFPGGFDTDTCALYNDCLAENIINCTSGGAVAVIMNSRVGLGTPPTMGPSEKLDKEFYKQAFVNENHLIGITHALSKDVYVPACDSAAHYLFCILELNLFGDPAMPMWLTEPSPLIVDHPDSIPLGTGDFTVMVSDSRIPVENALVCLMSVHGEIYVYDYTDASGQVTFTISPSIADTLWVTTTAMNHTPYEGHALIDSGNPGVEDNSGSECYTLFTFYPPKPSILTHQTSLSYCLDENGYATVEVYDITGRNLGAITHGIHKKGHYSTTWHGDMNGEKLSAGIYFLKLKADSKENLQKIIIAR